MEREWGNGERFILNIFSLFPTFIYISYINTCLILLQNVKYSTYVENVTKEFHRCFKKIILGRIHCEKVTQVVTAWHALHFIRPNGEIIMTLHFNQLLLLIFSSNEFFFPEGVWNILEPIFALLVPSKMSCCFLYGWVDTNFPGVSNIPSHRSHLILWKFGCCSPLSQFLVQTSFCREVGFGIFLWCSKAKFHTSPFRQRMFVINTTIWVVFEPHSTKNTFFSGNWLQTEILKH